MRLYKRVLWILLALVGIILTITTFSLWFKLPQIAPYVRNLLDLHPWLFFIFMGFTALIFVFFLVLLFASLITKSSTGKLIITTDHGDISLSKEAIDSIALNAVYDVMGSRPVKIKTVLKKRSDKIRILVKIYMETDTPVQKYASALQFGIEQSLLKMTGKPVTEVRITVEGQRHKDIAEPRKNTPRVV